MNLLWKKRRNSELSVLSSVCCLCRKRKHIQTPVNSSRLGVCLNTQCAVDDVPMITAPCSWVCVAFAVLVHASAKKNKKEGGSGEISTTIATWFHVSKKNKSYSENVSASRHQHFNFMYTRTLGNAISSAWHTIAEMCLSSFSTPRCHW